MHLEHFLHEFVGAKSDGHAGDHFVRLWQDARIQPLDALALQTRAGRVGCMRQMA